MKRDYVSVESVIKGENDFRDLSYNGFISLLSKVDPSDKLRVNFMELQQSYPDWLENGTEDEQSALDGWFDEVYDEVELFIKAPTDTY